MATNSVTGVGSGSAKGSEHMRLGVSKLIGPRWDEEKEKEFNNLKATVTSLQIGLFIANVAIIALSVSMYLSSK